MSHRKIQKQFLEYLDGMVVSARKQEIDDHLKQCQECRSALLEYKRVRALQEQIGGEQYRLGPDFGVKVMDKVIGQATGKKSEHSTSSSWWPGINLEIGGLFQTLLVASFCLLIAFSATTFLGDQASRTFSSVGSHMTVAPGNFSSSSYSDSGFFRREPTPVATAKPWQQPKSSETASNSQPYTREPADIVPPKRSETYSKIKPTPWTAVKQTPVSTFSIDVDTGSYSNIRRYLRQGQLPPTDAVRIEEMLNYFDYNYPFPRDETFAVHYELAPAPLEPQRYLLKVGVQARNYVNTEEEPWHLIFLIDVSGSMAMDNKLPLLKQSLNVLVDQMRAEDRLSIVTYSGRADLLLQAASVSEKQAISRVINNLQAGGGTHGSAGIDMAYQVAQSNRIGNGVNRVILATDGDFNVGTYSFEGLMNLIEQKRRSGITLTTLGFGTDNYNEKNLEQLADRGNGNYFYIDSFEEGRKVLSEKLAATIQVVASDVKLQLEFNPKRVVEYRLLGYENRQLARQDFTDDRVDAGEIGSGHSVTALYELVLAGTELGDSRKRELRYGDSDQAAEVREAVADEFGFLRIRYKEANARSSKEQQFPIDSALLQKDSKSSDDFRFTAAVAYFGELLRASSYAANYSYQDIEGLARSAIGKDPQGERHEFIRLVQNAAAASGGRYNNPE